MKPSVISAVSVQELVYAVLQNMQQHIRTKIIKPIIVRERVTYEMQNVLLMLTDPRKRWTILPGEKQPKMARMIGRVIWELTQRDDASSILPYDANALRFAKNNCVKAPYGKRLSTNLNKMLKHLKHEETSRRAVLLILKEEDEYQTELEYPCAIGLHFYIRDGLLLCTCYMRSQSVLKLLAQDLFVFTTIQEYVASKLHVPLGPYYHFITSAHIFEEDKKLYNTCKTHPSDFLSCGSLFTNSNKYPILDVLNIIERKLTAGCRLFEIAVFNEYKQLMDNELMQWLIVLENYHQKSLHNYVPNISLLTEPYLSYVKSLKEKL